MGKSKTVSAVKGKGSIRHNNRNFYAGNVDKNRTKDNIIYKQEPLREAYQKCFETAIEEYNSIQKRADRKIDGIDGYMEKIKNSGNGEKLFYETIFQVGNKHDSHTGTLDGFLCTNILDDYMKKFEERNPHLYVFNAVMHLDEETPHIHIDYIPIADGYKQGMQVRNSLDRAFKQQGINGKANKFENSTIAWENREKDYIAELMKERNIERAPDTGLKRKHKSTEHYKATAAEIENQVKAVEVPITARPNKLNKNEVIIKKDDFELLQQKAKLVTVHQEATQQLEKTLTEKVNEAEQYRNKAEENSKRIEANLSWTEVDRNHYQKLYNEQIDINTKLHQIEKENISVKSENEALKAENASLTAYMSEKVEQASKPLQTQIEALKAENTALKSTIAQKVNEAVKKATEPLERQIEALEDKLTNMAKTISAMLMSMRYIRDEFAGIVSEAFLNATIRKGNDWLAEDGFIERSKNRDSRIVSAVREEVALDLTYKNGSRGKGLYHDNLLVYPAKTFKEAKELFPKCTITNEIIEKTNEQIR